MEIRIGAGLSTIDKTIKAWKLSSWAAQGVLTFYDTSNEFSELETITKIKATSYFKSITFFRLILKCIYKSPAFKGVILWRR